MAGKYQKVDDKRERVIAALLAFPIQREGAEVTGVGMSTIGNWLTQPEFRALYEAARREMLDGAKNALRAASLGAVNTLTPISGDMNAKRSARVSAAKSILGLVLRISETEDMLSRVEKLEAATHAE